MIQLTEQTIDIQNVIASVETGSAGAIDVFIGTVRNNSNSKAVTRLEYEAYESMALKKMHAIAKEAQAKWPVQKVAIVHRKGRLEIGEAAVVVAVSTPHRKAAFEACQFIIDTVKQVVPIWKKEFYEDGEVWVAAHA
jgi:molybdopterin synthase catalytic subunit